MMRMKIHLLTALFLLTAGAASAQWNVVRETERVMSFGSRPCFRVEFANAKSELVLDVWKEFVKNNFGGKTKKDKKTGEWVTTEANAAYISDGVFTIYVTVEQNDKNAALNAWFDIGKPNFLNSRDYPEAARETADVLRIFYYDVRRAVIGEEQKTAEEALKEQEAKLKKLEKENAALHQSVEDYKAKIKKAEDDILANTKQQESALVDIEAQKRRIEEIKMRLKNVENERQ